MEKVGRNMERMERGRLHRRASAVVLVAAGVAAVVLGIVGERNTGHVDIGPLPRVVAELNRSGRPLEYPFPTKGLDSSFYVVGYAGAKVHEGIAMYPDAAEPGIRAGLLAVSSRSPYRRLGPQSRGVRVMWCETSRWFEDPAFGDQFNAVGEKVAGPAPQGLDLLPIRIVDGRVIVDTASMFTGVPAGTNTTDQVPAGPPCVRTSAPERQGSGSPD